MKPVSAKQFLSQFNDFLAAMEVTPLVKKRITDQEQLVDLFRFWYMDCREQEAIAEAEERHGNDPFGLGDMLDSD